MLHRYWVTFEGAPVEIWPCVVGCGVTGFDIDDALELAQSSVFGGRELPKVAEVISDIDVSTLDPNHVLPNIGVTSTRGVWFPRQ
jgi:hypothetical protein